MQISLLQRLIIHNLRLRVDILDFSGIDLGAPESSR